MWRGRSAAGVFLGVLVLGLVTGCCGPAPKAWNVTVSLDEESWAAAGGGVIPSLEVDLVGINPTEKPNWEGYPVSKYFSPGNALRRDADRVTKTFTNEDRQAKTLTKKDPTWNTQWLSKKGKGKGAEWLVVLVNLPSTGAEGGGKDPRMLILPLACNQWKKGEKSLDIKVKSSMVICTTPLRPKKEK